MFLLPLYESFQNRMKKIDFLFSGISIATMVYVYKKNNEGDFICQHCEFTTPNQSTMHYHFKNHEGSLPYPCKHCDVRFIQKGLLDLHMKARHQDKLAEKDKKKFECPHKGCEYKDIRKGNVVIHYVRIHLQELVEKCKGKTTEQGMVTQCTSCSKSFKNMTNYYYHMKSCLTLQENHNSFKVWKTLTA